MPRPAGVRYRQGIPARSARKRSASASRDSKSGTHTSNPQIWLSASPYQQAGGNRSLAERVSSRAPRTRHKPLTPRGNKQPRRDVDERCQARKPRRDLGRESCIRGYAWLAPPPGGSRRGSTFGTHRNPVAPKFRCCAARHCYLATFFFLAAPSSLAMRASSA